MQHDKHSTSLLLLVLLPQLPCCSLQVCDAWLSCVRDSLLLLSSCFPAACNCVTICSPMLLLLLLLLLPLHRPCCALQVCDDWLSRVRDSLLCLSAAAGAQQHTIYHGMARLQELHSTLKSLTAHYQAQQQQLQQQHQQQEVEREKDRRRREMGASSAVAAAAASAAAAAAITGLSGSAQQQQQQQQSDRRGRHGKQQQGKLQRSQQQQQQQQQGTGRASSPTPGEHTKLKSRQASAAAADGQPGGSNSSSTPPALQEQLKALSQAYQASVLRIAAPLLSTLALLVDALVQLGEASSISGLQAWAHSTFYPTWKAVSRFYALDLSLDASGSSGLGSSSAPEEPHQPEDDPLAAAAAAAAGGVQGSTAGTLLLLSWMRGAAAQAEGQYELALQLHAAYVQSEAASIPLGQCLSGFVVEQMAACYAAVGDWQGLTGLTASSSSSSRQGVQAGLQQQQQQQQEFGAQHWALAGAAGIAALQQWQETEVNKQQQQQQHQRGQQCLRAGMFSRLDCAQLPALTAAAHTIMNALAVLESSSASSKAPLQQQQQQQGLLQRHKQGGSLQHNQQAQQQQQQQVLSEVQAQLQELSSPQHILAACSSSQGQRWQQLAVLQLLRAILSSHQQQQQEQQGGVLSGGVEQLLQLLPHLQRSNQGLWGASYVRSSCSWDGALRCDGRLQASCFEDVKYATPLIQVGKLPVQQLYQQRSKQSSIETIMYHIFKPFYAFAPLHERALNFLCCLCRC
jgi:hypothetical protein